MIAIISQLIIQLHDCNEEDIAQRLLKKMTDSNGEKLDRCAELCVKYAKILLSSEKQIESTAEALKVHLIYLSHRLILACCLFSFFSFVVAFYSLTDYIRERRSV